MVWQNGETWQDMRQCVMKALGGCGIQSVMQSETLEERIQHEVGKLVREFAKYEQECKPFCPFDLLHKAVCNIICSVVFGCRYVVVPPDILFAFLVSRPPQSALLHCQAPTLLLNRWLTCLTGSSILVLKLTFSPDPFPRNLPLSLTD